MQAMVKMAIWRLSPASVIKDYVFLRDLKTSEKLKVVGKMLNLFCSDWPDLI